MRFPKRGLLYAGVASIVVGFALIGYVWGQVAGLTAVPLQLPYFASGGLASLGLIIVGVTLISIQTKLADAQRRDRQIAQLSELLDQIRVLLGGEERPVEAEAGGQDPEGAVPEDAESGLDETSEIPLAKQPFEKTG